MSGDSELFAHFISVLEEAGVPYCILAGYDGYPERIGSDVDFMVPAAWAGRLPGLIATGAGRGGAHLIQYLRHETTAAYFVVARTEHGRVTYLHPDWSADYRRRGRLWLEARQVLEHRRRHARGFWIPAAADAFAYYLIKKIDKGHRLQEDQAEQLRCRFLEDPVGGARVLREWLPEKVAAQVEEAVRTGQWEMAPALGQLRALLNSRAPAEKWDTRVRQAVSNARRFASRLAAPTGLHIVFLGPDGSGKSSIIERVSLEMAQAFRRVSYHHLRPGLLVSKRAGGMVTDPHAKPLRGNFLSILKLIHFTLDYWVGGLVSLWPAKVRSTFVVFDRYFHDLLADPRRYRYGGPPRLARLLGRTVPQPDLVFLLDAPPELLQQRKQEIPLSEGVRQRGAYLALQPEFREARVIDVSQSLDQVVSQVLGEIIAFQARRIAARLEVQQSSASIAVTRPAA